MLSSIAFGPILCQILWGGGLFGSGTGAANASGCVLLHGGRWGWIHRGVETDKFADVWFAPCHLHSKHPEAA